MEIIEKQTIKEVPVDGNYGYGYGRKDIMIYQVHLTRREVEEVSLKDLTECPIA